jgi:hypothetical protein
MLQTSEGAPLRRANPARQSVMPILAQLAAELQALAMLERGAAPVEERLSKIEGCGTLVHLVQEKLLCLP